MPWRGRGAARYLRVMRRTTCARFVRIPATGLWMPVILTALLQIGPAHAERIRLYEAEAYSGSGKMFLDAAPALRDANGGKYKSAKIATGRWLLCDRAFYAGDCLWISSDASSFERLGFGGDIASLRPERVPVLRREWGERKPPSRSALVFFDEPDFRGEWIALHDSVADLANARMQLTPASIVLQEGAWKICTEPNFAGSCLSMTASAWDLGQIFSTEIRSAQRLP
jgi:hypothetical protein